MKIPPTWCRIIAYLFALTRLSMAADTTSVRLYQLNHYYTLNAFSRLDMNTPHFLIRANYQNSSNVYKKPGDPTRIKQENALETRFLYKQNPLFFIGPSFRGYCLSDEQHSSENDYTNSRIVMSGLFQKTLSLSGNAGLFQEKRRGIQDVGWYSALELLRENQQNMLTPTIRFQYDKTPHRVNYTTDNILQFKTAFIEDIFNNLNLHFKETRREYFVNPSDLSRTEIRTTSTRQVQDKFSYIFPWKIRFLYNVRFSSTTDILDFYLSDSSATRKRDSYQLHNQFVLTKKQGNLNVKGEFTLDQNQDQSSADRDEIRVPADYKYARKTINTQASYTLSTNDSLLFRYQVSLLHFDTPDSNNTDDRDELSYVVNPQLSLRLSPYIRWNLSGQMYLHHLIYLHAGRSGQNHWNRVYSLRSHLNLAIPARLIWSSTQSLSSNYFVYDFEDSAFVNVSSQIFRSLYMDQNVDYFFTSSWGISLRLSGRFEDDGALNWSRFIQDKNSERIQVNQEYLISYRKGAFKISGGPVFSKRWFYQKGPDDQWALIHYVYRRGMTGEFQFHRNVRFKYTLEAIRQSGQKKVYNQNGFLQIHFIL
jgi:hypothetical protein